MFPELVCWNRADVVLCSRCITTDVGMLVNCAMCAAMFACYECAHNVNTVLHLVTVHIAYIFTGHVNGKTT